MKSISKKEASSVGNFEIYKEMVAEGKHVVVTSKFIADFMGVTPMCICNWRRNGLGPKYRQIGKTVRYDFRDFLDWLQDGEKNPKAFPDIF